MSNDKVTTMRLETRVWNVKGEKEINNLKGYQNNVNKEKLVELEDAIASLKMLISKSSPMATKS